MKLMIGTPAYNYQVTAEYHSSVLKLVQHFALRRPDVGIESRIVGGALLAMNRNVLANLVLRDPGFSHLLFVDADTGFRPDLIEKMIDFDKPLVGCIYPNRTRKLDRIIETARRGAELGPALDAGNTYVGAPLIEEGRAQTQGPFVRAVEVGTGLMLIKREVLEQLASSFPDLWTEDQVYKGLGMDRVVQLFDSFQGPTGLFYGEDVAFCRRWVDRCSGEIWACFDAEITHIGRDRVVGNYANRLAPAGAGGTRIGASLR